MLRDSRFGWSLAGGAGVGVARRNGWGRQAGMGGVAGPERVGLPGRNGWGRDGEEPGRTIIKVGVLEKKNARTT